MSNVKSACFLLFALASLALHGDVATADAPTQPYQLTVWADVQFDETGRPTKVDFAQKDQLPAAFIQFLNGKVLAHVIAPRTDGTTAVVFESGVMVQVEIRPEATGPSAAILEIREMPRPVRLDQANPIRLRLKGEWSGSFVVRCRIGVNGRCSKPEADSTANIPAEMQRMLKSIASAWRFVPQKLAGKPVEGEYETTIMVEGDTSAPPEEFGKHL